LPGRRLASVTPVAQNLALRSKGLDSPDFRSVMATWNWKLAPLLPSKLSANGDCWVLFAVSL